MKLQPAEPPGHARRKLRGLVSEIQRLRSEGYTIGAIHQALEAAGIKVGWSTVQREAARLAPASPAPKVVRSTVDEPLAPTDAGQAKEVPGSSDAGVDVDSFFDRHNTNPLFRKKGRQA